MDTKGNGNNKVTVPNVPKELYIQSDFEYLPEFMTYETGLQRAWRICKEAPFLPIAIFGGLGILAHGIINSRKRGRPLSQYLIHYRVYIQGYIVGTMGAGVGIQALTDYAKGNYNTDTKEKKDL